MAPKRSLPSRRNPLLAPEHTPFHNVLVDRRRLGSTELKVEDGLKGTSNATKEKNLGIFDYAHLRAPLPKDLKGSGIFLPTMTMPVPDSYFLMRRSSDGFISATGMFKAAFPWASQEEEEFERKYIKKLPTTDHEEVAGNIWVPPEHALDLAVEYSILAWIEALLDPEDIHLHSLASDKTIKSPPRFTGMARKPAGTATGSQRKQRKPSRDIKSTSPSTATPGDASTMSPPSARPKASPRKRAPKKDSSSSTDVTTSPKSATKALQAALESSASGSSDSTSPAAAAVAKDKVRVSVHSATEHSADGTETTHTAVKVDVPAGSKELPLPTNAEGLVELGKEIVAEAVKLEEAKKTSKEPAAGDAPAAATGGSKRKRKADKLLEDAEAAASAGTGKGGAALQEMQAAKRVRTTVLEDEVKREKVKARALMGLSATLVVGALIPYVANFF